MSKEKNMFIENDIPANQDVVFIKIIKFIGFVLTSTLNESSSNGFWSKFVMYMI